VPGLFAAHADAGGYDLLDRTAALAKAHCDAAHGSTDLDVIGVHDARVNGHDQNGCTATAHVVMRIAAAARRRLFVAGQFPKDTGVVVLHAKVANQQHQDIFGGAQLPLLDLLQHGFVDLDGAGNFGDALMHFLADRLQTFAEIFKRWLGPLFTHSVYGTTISVKPQVGRQCAILVPMIPAQNVPLKDYSTMRLGGPAAYMTEVTSRTELEEAIAWADARQLPVLMIGSGSNIIWKDEGFAGLVILSKIMRFEEQMEDDENYYVTIGAGENWDSVVARTVEKGMTGIEALSLIPGTAGATPIQNVGAYGQEISSVLVSVEAYDHSLHAMVTIPGVDCGFAYRTSRFKTTDRGRFFITAITLHLLHKNPAAPFYPSVQKYLDEHTIHDYTPLAIREAVLDIRKSKLPDPNKVANNGSFFANPFIDEAKLVQLQADYGNVPHWPTEDGQFKMPAAWLIEKAGFKDVHDPETGMATWPMQPLVLINEHATSTAQVLAFKQKIVSKVEEIFGIILIQEPELLP
jgi:UDP-N-acetylmuramate dehydrogenase